MTYFPDLNIKKLTDAQLQERIVKLQKMKDYYTGIGSIEQIAQAGHMLDELRDEFSFRLSQPKKVDNKRKQKTKEVVKEPKDDTINIGSIEQGIKDDEWDT